MLVRFQNARGNLSPFVTKTGDYQKVLQKVPVPFCNTLG